MRRMRMDEDLHKEQPVVQKVKDVKPVCGMCGSVLEIDEESHEYLCPVCDAEEQS